VDVEHVVAELLGESVALLVLHVDTGDPCAGAVEHLHRAAPDAVQPPVTIATFPFKSIMG
jgi:hypothetical protein